MRIFEFLSIISVHSLVGSQPLSSILVPKAGFEPARLKATRPSSVRVYQFRHLGLEKAQSAPFYFFTNVSFKRFVYSRKKYSLA